MGAGYTWCETTATCERPGDCPTPAPVPAPAMPGSDADEHGCRASAGYSWCETTQECVREWETSCPLPQCGRVCTTNSDCSNEGGRWDKGMPWCGLCDNGRCHAHYEDCQSDSDCGSKANVGLTDSASVNKLLCHQK